MLREEKGFTLVEMLLVVAIIAFLVAILVPAVGNIGANAKERACRADLKALKAAVEVYKVNNGAFPTENTWESCLQSETDRLVDIVPNDPYLTSQKYQYDLSTAGRDTYAIYSVGVDGDGSAAAGDDTCTLTNTPFYVTNAKTIN